MNQILQTETGKRNGQIEIGKIIKFFAIAIIIFAIILIGLGAYYMIANSNEQNPQVIAEPNVEITKQDDENLLIQVTGNVEISKIIYNWNGEEDITIDSINSTNVTESIDLPYGTNTLNLTVIDINGTQTKYEKEYVIDGNGKPIIELKLTQDNKIKITVQDETGLQYITYAWNNNEPEKIDADLSEPNSIDKIVEIPLGLNTLKVEAINNGNVVTTKELEVKGVNTPTLTFKKQGNSIIIRAEDQTGLKVIDYTLNGQRYQLNYGNKTVIEYKQILQSGENNMEITAENQDGGKITKKVKIMN